jgi:hypothetical protein
MAFGCSPAKNLLLLPLLLLKRNQSDLTPVEEKMLENRCRATDKWEAAVAMQLWTEEEKAARQIEIDRRSAPTPSSSLFDDCYVAGRHTNPAGVHGITPCRYPHNQLRQTGALNPSDRSVDTPLTYLQAFHTDLTTAQDVDRHEARIFQHGYTPDNIRRNIKLILRTALPDQHIVEFQVKDIPPVAIDSATNMILHALLAERIKADLDIALCLTDKADDGSNLDPSKNIEEEYLRLDKAHNDTNRAMYQVYSDSWFVIHDNNFVSYCRPHLHNLPASTAFELQTVREQLQTNEGPPCRPIHHEALPTPTVPTFTTTLAQHAQQAKRSNAQQAKRTRPSLRPRPQ